MPNPLVPFKSNQELVDEEVAAAEQEASPASATEGLVSLLREKWTEARNHRDQFTEVFLSNLRNFKSQYSDKKLAEIRELGGSESFMPLINIKCRAAEAWISDVLFQPSKKDRPWDISTTPDPDLTKETEAEIAQNLVEEVQRAMEQAIKMAEQTGQQVSPETMRQLALTLRKKMSERKEKEQKEVVDERLKELKQKLDDQLVEGSYYEALRACLKDFVKYPSCILKGPVYRFKKRMTKQNMELEDGTSESNYTVVHDNIPYFERRSPFNIYPSPRSVSIQDDYLVDLIQLSPKQLADLKGSPGFKDDAIDNILDLHEKGGLKEWTAYQSDVEKEHKGEDNNASRSNLIDVLEFWDDIRGKELINLGFDTLGDVPLDENEYYSICAWLVKDEVIGAMMNPDPMGMKPYSTASFVSLEDSFWGLSPADILDQLQQSVNALKRAAVNNAALSSGPLIERNIDRMAPGETKSVYPWRVFDSTNKQMATNAAYVFYQPTFMADRLVTVLSMIMKHADELSGIPAYAHGDVTVGGAGRTSSGLHLLASNAARGIKDAIRNIDRSLIVQPIQIQHRLNLMDGDVYTQDPPDTTIVAQGSDVLLEKESMATRQMEFLQIITNPTDMQLQGMEGRRNLLGDIAKSMGLDNEGYFEGIDDPVRQMMQAFMEDMQPNAGSSAPSPNTQSRGKQDEQANKGAAGAFKGRQ